MPTDTATKPPPAKSHNIDSRLVCKRKAKKKKKVQKAKSYQNRKKKKEKNGVMAGQY